jgi:hypothetical protein
VSGEYQAADAGGRRLGEGPIGAPGILEAIASLLDKSLLQWTDGRGTRGRLGMLETIREFAAERLQEAGEAERARGPRRLLRLSG